MLFLIQRKIVEILKKIYIKRYTRDFTLRLSASVISTIVSKVLLLPVLALMFSEEEYGLMLTIIGIESLISLVFGNTLYTVRMIMHSEYEKWGLVGDFNILAIVTSSLAGILVIPVIFLFPDIALLDKIFLVPYVILATINLYFTVYYSITLRFKDGLYQAMVTSIGLLMGIPIAWVLHSWVVCYLSSAIFGFVYLVWRTDIVRESLKKTLLFKTTLIKYYLLMIATIFSGGIVYLDRFILYPMIGASAVTMYITASYFGKSISVLAQPASNVMLSYFSQGDFNFSMKKYYLINLLIIVSFSIFTLIALFFGESITRLLFPKLVESASPYIFIANLSAGVSALTQLIKPVALRFAETKWQTVIQFLYILIYLIFGVLSLHFWGLIGFCYSVLIVNVLQFGAQNLICYRVIKNRKN